ARSRDAAAHRVGRGRASVAARAPAPPRLISAAVTVERELERLAFEIESGVETHRPHRLDQTRRHRALRVGRDDVDDLVLRRLDREADAPVLRRAHRFHAVLGLDERRERRRRSGETPAGAAAAKAGPAGAKAEAAGRLEADRRWP